MQNKIVAVLFALCFFALTACGGGQTVYYWERPNTGVNWFVRDHNQCLRVADWWPYEWPGFRFSGPWGWDTPPDLDLRFDNDASNGIWAEYTPFPGAQPVYVNSRAGDWSMSASTYEKCMEQRQYRQYKPSTRGREVFQQ